MLALLLARYLGDKAGRIIADLLPYLAVAAVVWWVVSSDAKAREERQALKQQLAAEQSARIRDAAGLTALSHGLAKVSTDTAKDAQAIKETINVANPNPASPALNELFAKLRDNDAARNSTVTGTR